MEKLLRYNLVRNTGSTPRTWKRLFVMQNTTYSKPSLTTCPIVWYTIRGKSKIHKHTGLIRNLMLGIPSRSSNEGSFGSAKSARIAVRSPAEKTQRPDSGTTNPSVNQVALERELVKLRVERDRAVEHANEWQSRAASLKAELEKERGSIERVLAAQNIDQEREIRKQLHAEWAKSEAAWKERIRNERLLRLSYERILLNLGFAPNRIASDLVKTSRPQPISNLPEEYRTMDLLEMDVAVMGQTESKRKGLFAYGIEDIKATMNEAGSEKRGPPLEGTEDFGPKSQAGNGKRELLKSLALASAPN